MAASAANPVIGGSVSYAVDGDKVRTTLSLPNRQRRGHLVRADGRPDGDQRTGTAGSYDSIYGPMSLYRAPR